MKAAQIVSALAYSSRRRSGDAKPGAQADPPTAVGLPCPLGVSMGTPIEPTKIVFPAVLAVDQFDTQDVLLTPNFPTIAIVLIDSAAGLHEFKISKLLPHQHQSVLLSAVAEAKSQIEHFWTVLAFVRDTTIRPTGEVFYEINNQRHEVYPRRSGSSARLVGVAGSGWFDSNKDALTAPYDLERLKRLNFACGIAEPIGRFVALYALLLSEAGDSQSEVDRLILEFDPNTQQSPSPKNGKLETLYTRLRNELAHVRPTSNVFSTHDEIELHLQRFQWLVKSILRPLAL